MHYNERMSLHGESILVSTSGKQFLNSSRNDLLKPFPYHANIIAILINMQIKIMKYIEGNNYLYTYAKKHIIFKRIIYF
jgi:hypothetical protein